MASSTSNSPPLRRPTRRAPPHAGHADVHQHHVGLVGDGELDRLGAVDRLAHHLEPGFALDEHAEAGSNERLVVGQQDPDHGAGTVP
jgi:hypothetical protein